MDTNVRHPTLFLRIPTTIILLRLKTADNIPKNRLMPVPINYIAKKQLHHSVD
jgi:hypothetical protein